LPHVRVKIAEIAQGAEAVSFRVSASSNADTVQIEVKVKRKIDPAGVGHDSGRIE
jgi:hypothetical protein